MVGSYEDCEKELMLDNKKYKECSELYNLLQSNKELTNFVKFSHHIKENNKYHFHHKFMIKNGDKIIFISYAEEHDIEALLKSYKK